MKLNYEERYFSSLYDSGGIWTREAFIAQDIKSYTIDRTRGRCLNAPLTGDFFAPWKGDFFAPWKGDFIHDGIRTRNLQIRSLTRYPVAPHGLLCVSALPLAGLEPATSGS